MSDIKTPLPVIMDKAKQEIGNHVIAVMEANEIPPGMMVYILDSIKCDVSIAWKNHLNNLFINLQKEGAKNGNTE